MFEYIKGNVEIKKPEYLAVDVNGIGYKIYITLRTYEKVQIEENVKLFIYNHIKEDTFKLIGFLKEEERKVFELLLGVKGIGVSLAISILSTFDIDTLRNLIQNDDYKSLKKVPKLGEKKAQQIILDIGDKVKTIGDIAEISYVNSINNVEQELYDALESLGYSKKEIDVIVSKEEIKTFKNIEDAIKKVLQKIKF